MSTIKKLIADLDTSIAQLSETMTDYGKGKLQAFRDVRIHIQNEVPDNEESLRQKNKELVEMLEIVKSNLTFYDQKLYNQITELLNKVNPKTQAMKTVIHQLIETLDEMINNGGDPDLLAVKVHLENSLEAEKEQIWMAFNDGKVSAIVKNQRTPEEYYNITYKSEE